MIPKKSWRDISKEEEKYEEFTFNTKEYNISEEENLHTIAEKYKSIVPEDNTVSSKWLACSNKQEGRYS